MPRYYIDFQDGNDLCRDDDGNDFPDIDAARGEAVGVVSLMAKDRLPGGEKRTFTATVRDESKCSLYRATLTFHGEWLSDAGGRGD